MNPQQSAKRGPRVLGALSTDGTSPRRVTARRLAPFGAEPSVRYSRSSRSHPGPTTSAPRASARRRSSRSAVTSMTTSSDAFEATSMSVSSPLPAAWRTVTPSATPPCTPSRALPSRTTMAGSATRPESTAALNWSTNARAAPARSRHQPVGRDPITFAASMRSTASLCSFLQMAGAQSSTAESNRAWFDVHPDRGAGSQTPSGAARSSAASAPSPLISTLAAPWRPALNMVSSPGSPDRVRRGPLPRSMLALPGEVITMVAGTFLAIPPGPTRAQRASANSGEIGRGSQPSCARRTSSTCMKNSTVFIGPSKGRRRNGGPRRTVSTSFAHGVRTRAAIRTLSV